MSSNTTAPSHPAESSTQPAVSNSSLHPSFGVSNIKNYVNEALNFTNYLLWRSLIIPVLQGYDVYDHVDGSVPAPPCVLTNSAGESKPNPDFLLWKQIDRLVLSWIQATLSPDILRSLIKPNVVLTAQQAWEAIETLFHDQAHAKLLQLKADFYSTVKDNSTIDEYLQKLKTVYDSLCSIGHAITEDDLVMQILDGLPVEYENVVINLTGKKPLPSFAETRTSLYLQELRLQSRAKKQSQPVPNPANSQTALVSTERNSSSNQRGRGGRGRGGRNSGYYHNTGGDSYGRGGRGGRSGRGGRGYYYNQSSSMYHPGSNFSGSYNGVLGPRPTGFSSPYAGFPPQSAGFSQPTQCQICLEYTHIARDCPHFTRSGQFSGDRSFAAVQFPEPVHSAWLPDTGATSHMTPNPGILSSCLPTPVSNTVVFGNGHSLPVTHIGSNSFPLPSRDLLLKDVLVVPSLTHNLISVKKFARDNSCSVEFDPYGFCVKDLKTRTPLLSCSSPGDLYEFSPSSFSSSLSGGSTSLIASANSFELWHRRLGHPNSSILSKLFRTSSFNKVSCTACRLGKHTKLSFSHSHVRASAPFALIHSDVWSSPVSSFSGYRYYVVFMDDYSRYVWLYPLKRKSEVYNYFVSFVAFVKTQFGVLIKCLQCDGGGEYISNHFQQFASNNGIRLQFSCPYTPQQNGAAERLHRTLINMVRTLLTQSNLSLQFWVEAVHMAVHLHNILPSETLQFKSPYEQLLGKPPSYTHLRVFGCSCFPNITATVSHKLENRSIHCIFLGYPDTYKGFRCYNPKTGKVIISRHVLFDEHQFPFLQFQQHVSAQPAASVQRGFHLPSFPRQVPLLQSCSSNNRAQNQQAVTVQDCRSPVHSEPTDSGNQSPADHFDTTSPAVADSTPIVPNETNNALTLFPADLAITGPSTQTLHPMQTRLKDGIRKPKKIFSLTAHGDQNQILPEPKTYTEAQRHHEWRKAMSTEYDALLRNQTWKLVPKPSNVNIIGSKWVYKVKLRSDGTLERYKARLVAQGYAQKPGLDYDETYSPVVKPTTIRTVLSLAVSRQWPVHQLDVKNAFLHGVLKENVYMKQPRGFIHPAFPEYVCQLQKALYGLKQAPRAWFERFTNFLKMIGFKGSRADSSMFVLREGQHMAVLLLYVDDIVLTASSQTLMSRLLQVLKSEFAMSDLGSLHYFLGISVKQNLDGLFLHQYKYATDLLKRAGMEMAKPVSTPTLNESLSLSSDSALLSDPQLYRSLVGALQYLTFTRPDIAFAVNQVCQFMHNPREKHMLAVKRILRYVKGTVHYGLQFYKGGSQTLTAYSDADWAGCHDTRRSTTGFCLYFGNNLISWSAKKQPTVSRSSAEAEYRAVASTVAELTWITSLLRELGIQLEEPPVVFCDNISTTYMSANPIQHARTKHIELDIHFVREKVISGHLQVHHIASTDQTADVFTKGLSGTRFRLLRDNLCVMPHID